MFKKDSMWLGIGIGIVVLIVGYYTLHFLNIWISDYFFNRTPVFRERTIQVLSIFLNVFPFRYFMLKTEKEYTGRGILLVTFVVGLSFFFYYLN
ncbi:MAG: hypothetical protein IPK08_13950 [Bacteroidetes bacterium]|nr:hypothetical protein [Bacteroidota bacterium]